jgi:hypothetical protein
MLEDALADIEGKPSPEASGLLALLATSDHSDRGDAYAERARVMAQELGLGGADWPWRIETREQLRLMERGDYDGAAALGERVHRDLVELGTGGTVAALALNLRWVAFVEAGAIDRALEALRVHLAFCEERRFVSLWEGTQLRLAWLELLRNDRARFDAIVMEGGRGQPFLLTLAATTDALVRGDVEEATRLLPEHDHADRVANDYTLLGTELRVLVARGDREAAERSFVEWRTATSADKLVGPYEAVRAYVNAAESILVLGDLPFIETAYRTLNEYKWFRFAFFGVAEAADVMRGALALRLGNVDAAERHFVEGLQWARQPDVRFGLVEARCLQGLAEVAERRGEQAVAMQHLDAAGELFAEYGAKLYLDQVLAKKDILKA